MMGGEIHVQSSQNEGSSFWITMQFETQQPGQLYKIDHAVSIEESEPLPEDELTLDARILLAEDNAINQEVASAMLESSGCEVVAVDNGLKALQALETDHYDLVLMDCQMPTMDGFEATRTIREQNTKYPQIPIIALTADIQHGIVGQCRKAGMDDYLSKPFTHESLLEMVMKWLPDRTAAEARTSN